MLFAFCLPSVCIRDIEGVWAVKLFIDFVVVLPPVDTIFDFRAAYRSENLSLKYEQYEQDWADQGLVNGEFCLA
jgi:hypothetical protein